MKHFPTVCPRVFRYGFVVLAQMGVACSVPSETVQLADLMGKWENVDQKTDHVTRVEILQPDSTHQFLIRMWGSREPEDCFWGDNTGSDIVGGSNIRGTPGLSLEWESESWITTQRVRLVGPVRK